MNLGTQLWMAVNITTGRDAHAETRHVCAQVGIAAVAMAAANLVAAIPASACCKSSSRRCLPADVLLATAAAGARVSDLTDGLKYVLGSKYLPTGFEVGFNHYAGACQSLSRVVTAEDAHLAIKHKRAAAHHACCSLR